MLKIKILVKHLLFLLLFCFGMIWIQSPKPIFNDVPGKWMDDVENIGAYFMNQESIPGYQLTYFSQGEIVESISTGLSSKSTQNVVEEHTIFSAQSMTKTMTAVMILKLVEDQKLSLNQKINELLTEEVLNAIPNQFHDVTIESLMTHQGGMPTGDFNRMYDLNNQQIPSLQSSILMDIKNAPFKTGFHYSNVGYHVLEMVIRNVSGMDYDQYAKHSFSFLPTNAINFSQADLTDRDLAYGYDLKFEEVAPYRYPELASGGLYTTSINYLTFLIHLLTEKIISKAYIDLMFSIQVSELGYYSNIYDGYGFGAFINQNDQQTIISHGGQGKGYMSYYHVNLEDMSGFVILTNSQRSYPFFAALTDSFNTYHQLEEDGLNRIQWVSTILMCLSALSIYIAARLIYSMTKIKTSKRSEFTMLQFIIYMTVMIGSIILQNQSYNMIYSLAPYAYDQFLVIVFITCLFGTVFTLAKQLLYSSKGGEIHVINT